MPDREERFRVMLDMVEAAGRAPSRGSWTSRAVRAVSRTGCSQRFPDATSTGVDLDPALLAIARGHLRGRRPGHLRHRRPEGPGLDRAAARTTSYDAVLTATALHWLHSEPLARPLRAARRRSSGTAASS